MLVNLIKRNVVSKTRYKQAIKINICSLLFFFHNLKYNKYINTIK